MSPALFGNARRLARTLLAVAACALGAATAVAAVTVDVPVNVGSLSPMVTDITVACMVCVGECQSGLGYTPFTGAVTRSVKNGGYQGTVRVVVPNTVTPADHDHYLCRLEIGASSFPYPAGTTGPAWSLPAPGTPFVGEIKGPLPLCPLGQYAKDDGSCARSIAIDKSKLSVCRAGYKLVDGTCVLDVGVCPPGQTGQPGQCLCTDGKAPEADGTCNRPAADATPGIGLQRFVPCANGEARDANGQCPAKPASKFRLHNLAPLIQAIPPPDTNSTLH